MSILAPPDSINLAFRTEICWLGRENLNSSRHVLILSILFVLQSLIRKRLATKSRDWLILDFKFLQSIAICSPHRMDTLASNPQIKLTPDHFHPVLSPSPSFSTTTISPFLSSLPFFLLFPFHLFTARLLWRCRCTLQSKQSVSVLSAWAQDI